MPPEYSIHASHDPVHWLVVAALCITAGLAIEALILPRRK